VDKHPDPSPNWNPAHVKRQGKKFIYQKGGLMFKRNRKRRLERAMGKDHRNRQNALNIGWFSDI
jgi:hypothetical protein